MQPVRYRSVCPLCWGEIVSVHLRAFRCEVIHAVGIRPQRLHVVPPLYTWSITHLIVLVYTPPPRSSLRRFAVPDSPRLFECYLTRGDMYSCHVRFTWSPSNWFQSVAYVFCTLLLHYFLVVLLPMITGRPKVSLCHFESVVTGRPKVCP